MIVRLHDIHFGYTGKGDLAPEVLQGVTLDIGAGDRVGLLGASGAGKSTLLHLIAGLLRPQTGKLERASDAGGTVSLVFQFPERQLFAETVTADVAYGLRESGVPREAIAARVAHALEDVGLPETDFGHRAPFHLSGGEMRRVALAGALAQERAVLLLDEPTLGLDAEGIERLRVVLDRVHGRGVACWIASHDADFIAKACNRIVVLDTGRVAFDGAPAQLWRQPARAESLGTEQPGYFTLAARLRAAGVALPMDLETEEHLVMALGAIPSQR